MCVTCAGHVHDGMLWAEKFMSTSRPKGTGTAVPSCRLRTTTTASLLARHAGLGSAVADNRIVTAEALPKAAPQWKQP